MTDPAVVAALRTLQQRFRKVAQWAACADAIDPLLAQLEQPDTLEHEAAAVLALTHGQQQDQARITELEAALAASEARVQALEQKQNIPSFPTLTAEQLDTECHCGYAQPDAEPSWQTTCPVIQHRARSGVKWRESYLELNEYRLELQAKLTASEAARQQMQQERDRYRELLDILDDRSLDDVREAGRHGFSGDPFDAPDEDKTTITVTRGELRRALRTSTGETTP